MQARIAIFGVLLPALVAVVPLIAWWVHRRRKEKDASLRWSAAAVALAAALSFHARQGFAFPPAEAWQWVGMAIACLGAVGWVAGSRNLGVRGCIVAALVAAGSMAFLMRLPGLADLPWRIGILVVAAVVAALLARSGAARAPVSAPLAWGGLFMAFSVQCLAAGFEKLGSMSAATGLVLLALAGLGSMVKGFALGAGATVTVAVLFVTFVTVGAAYAPDDLPWWRWPAMAAMPLAMLAADARFLPKESLAGGAVRAALPLAGAAVVVGPLAGALARAA